MSSDTKSNGESKFVLDGLARYKAHEIWKSVDNLIGTRTDGLLIGEALYAQECQTDHIGFKVETLSNMVDILADLSHAARWGSFRKLLESEAPIPVTDPNRYTDGYVSVVYTNKHNVSFLVVLSYILSITNLGVDKTTPQLPNVPKVAHEVYYDPELVHKYAVHIYPYNSHP